MKNVSILVVDDHDLVRKGVIAVLAAESSWNVIGEAANGLEALEMVNKHNPDVVILDYLMPILNGIDCAKKIFSEKPQIKILMITMFDSNALYLQLRMIGVHGLIAKKQSSELLVKAISRMLSGDTFFNGYTDKVISGNNVEHDEDLRDSFHGVLTNRERQVLQLLAESNSAKDIGIQLYISKNTVEVHRANIKRKLGFKTISELVRYAIRNNIIQA